MSRETEALLAEIDAVLAEIDAALIPTPDALAWGPLLHRLRAWVAAVESTL